MKFRPTAAAIALGVIANVAAVSAYAQERGSAQAQSNAERGKVLAYTCHGCHGVPNYKNAYPNYSVPKLGGQNARYLANALKAYSTGERPHQTMHSQATTLSDQDRVDVAAYLQGEPVQPGKQAFGAPPPAAQTCVACHGADGAKTLSPEYPVLAGQYADYIVQALKDYKAGRRKNPVMGGIIAGVNESEFEALARFFQNQGGLCSTEDIRKTGKCEKE
ncbi:MAG TPA: c-type cytochrome [Steroidobacter sp.]|jgi:cytochrome c553|nr:c-type cytochrome [Steroidobacter sp.]